MGEIKISAELEEKIQNAASIAEVAQICNDAGIHITKEQLENEMIPEKDGELNEVMLDNVSGGGIVRFAFKIVSIFCGGRSNGDGSGGRFSAGGGGGGR